MLGEQLLASGKMYGREYLELLGEEFLKTVGVKRLAKVGVMEENRAVKERKAARLAEKIARSTRVSPTIVDFEDRAAESVIANDATWQDPTKSQRKADLELLASERFWAKLLVRNPNPAHQFKTVLRNVLPDFWNEETMGPKAKKRIMPDLSEYLYQVRTEAAKQLDPDERQAFLEQFILIDKTDFLSVERSEAQQFKMRATALLNSCGTAIDNQFKNLGGMTPADWDAADDEDESDDEDDDDSLV